MILWLRIGNGSKSHAFLNLNASRAICGRTGQIVDGTKLERCANCLYVIGSWPKAKGRAA